MMRFSTTIAATLLALGGCSKGRESPPSPAVTEHNTAASITEKAAVKKSASKRADATAAESVEVDADDVGQLDTRSDAPVMRVLSRADITAARLLSPRSLSVKLWLKGGSQAVFKPLLKKDRRARFEVAAHRLAELLAVDGVPAATMRELRLETLTNRLEKGQPDAALRLKEEALLAGNERVTGAMIAWVEDIDREGLDALGGIPGIRSWLGPARPRAEDEPPLADDAARMVVFDYIIGNWDRFSGGNFYVSKGGERLVLLDHNGTFGPWEGKREEKMARLLKSIERFPAALVDKLRELTREEVSAALGKEPWHISDGLLRPEEIDLLFERRDALLKHIDLLVQSQGSDNVLVF